MQIKQAYNDIESIRGIESCSRLDYVKKVMINIDSVKFSFEKHTQK